VAACHTEKLATQLMEVFVTRKGSFIYPTQAQKLEQAKVSYKGKIQVSFFVFYFKKLLFK